MGICIDPALEFVWRDPHTVQLGVDPPRAVVAVPTTAGERFLSALRTETGRDVLPAVAAQYRCDALTAAEVLGAASPAMIEVATSPARPLVEVLGDDPVADRIVDLLGGEPVTVVRTVALPGGPVPAPDPRPVLAVVVASHVVDPAVRAAWTRRDVPHLAVVIGDGRVRVGPFVTPGAGPCLQCVDLTRADGDPAWPTLASQLWGRRPRPMTAYRTSAIAVSTVRLVLESLAAGAPPGPPGDQLVFDRGDLSITRRSVPPHPRCACRGLPGTGSAPGPRRVPNPVQTT